MINEDIRNKIINESRILIVDDIARNLQLLGTILSDIGFQVAIAGTGAQALSIASSKIPDLILLDVAMPEMNGFEVCKNLKDNPATKDIPVIFLTAKTEPEDIEKGFDVGGVDYITKPFNPRELVLRVINHLELQHTRESLKKLNKELIKSNEEKDKFLSIISHDLRSPFHGLLGVSQIIRENFDRLETDDLKEYFALLDEGLHNQFKFLNNILQWGKLRRGRFEIKKSKFALQNLIEDVIATLKINIELKQIYLEINIENELYLSGDRNLIQEVFHNLLSNSLKFSNDKGNIKLNCKQIENQLSVTIEDNGIGISPNNLERVFKTDRIFTTNGTHSEQGSGLGLLLCREIIEMHKGQISINSELGIGTKIQITIPNEE